MRLPFDRRSTAVEHVKQERIHWFQSAAWGKLMLRASNFLCLLCSTSSLKIISTILIMILVHISYHAIESVQDVVGIKAARDDIEPYSWRSILKSLSMICVVLLEIKIQKVMEREVQILRRNSYLDTSAIEEVLISKDQDCLTDFEAKHSTNCNELADGE